MVRLRYAVRAFPTGRLVVRGDVAVAGGKPDAGRELVMYVWLILGGPSPMVVDTGPKSLVEINRGLAGLTLEPVSRHPGESLAGILRAAGVGPEEVSHLFFTHMHYDHCSDFRVLPRARWVVSRRGWEEAFARLAEGRCWIPGEVVYPMMEEQDRLILAGDGEEVVPGVRVLSLGGHTPCSQAVLVETGAGTVAIAGDVVSVYENVEAGLPTGVAESPEECRAAVARLKREADIILPSHDPLVMVRYPGGLVE